jgi:hypothetical protein
MTIPLIVEPHFADQCCCPQFDFESERLKYAQNNGSLSRGGSPNDADRLQLIVCGR